MLVTATLLSIAVAEKVLWRLRFQPRLSRQGDPGIFGQRPAIKVSGPEIYLPGRFVE
jgi:hypothetical protein